MAPKVSTDYTFDVIKRMTLHNSYKALFSSKYFALVYPGGDTLWPLKFDVYY